MDCRNLAERLFNNEQKWETCSRILEGEDFYWLGHNPVQESKIIFTHYDDNGILKNNDYFPLILYFFAGLNNPSRSMMADRNRTFPGGVAKDQSFQNAFPFVEANARLQPSYKMSIHRALSQGVHRIDFFQTGKQNVYRPVLYSVIDIDGKPMKQITMLDKYFIFGKDGNTMEMATYIYKGHEELGIDNNDNGTMVFFEQPNFLHAEVL